MVAGEDLSASELVHRAERYREYFGKEGGITLSGGEPLLQADAAFELFSLCHEAGINTCLDTSGAVLNESVKRLLTVTDRVLLDIKYTNDAAYRDHVGCSMAPVLEFLALLNQCEISTTLRQVIIPTLNDTEENLRALKRLREEHSCVDGVELLPFRKLCQTKYDALSLPFPLQDIPEPTREKMQQLQGLL